MFISDFAIKRPLITVVSMLALVVFGLVALLQLQTDEFPDVQPPVVLTTVIYPGASPDGVEREVLDPVEEAISVDRRRVDQGRGEDGFARDRGVRVLQGRCRKRRRTSATRSPASVRTCRGDRRSRSCEVQPDGPPIVTLALNSSNAVGAAQLTRLADPTSRASSGRSAVWPRSRCRGCEARAHGRPRAGATGGGGVGRVAGGRGAAAAEPGGAGGRVKGALDERSIRLKGTPRLAAGVPAARGGRERNGRCGSPRRCGQAKDGTEEQRTLALYNGREAVGINIKKSKATARPTWPRDARQGRAAAADAAPGATLDVVKNAGTSTSRTR
jgi:hydrophobic/amphiphilic exporter-1 (mainly G- bacteria), HAE1 family